MPATPSPRPFAGRPFTGRHAAIIVVGFFAVVIAVNVTMARFAAATFGGTVVENSYVAGQKFNALLDSAAAERALGWHGVLTRSGPDAVLALTDAAGRPLAGARLAARAEHPLGVVPARDVTFREVSPGRYAGALPQGRWRLAIEVSAQGHKWHAVDEVR